MPTEVATLCFHTKDAQKKNGSFTFSMKKNNVRIPASRVALASCEFPMVQQTIENSWNRFYYCEALRITAKMSYLNITLMSSIDNETFVVRIPVHLNKAKCKFVGKTLRVTTEEFHNVCGERSVLSKLFRFKLIGMNDGDHEIREVKYVDEYTFDIRSFPHKSINEDANLLALGLDSPFHLAIALTEASQRVNLPVSFTYEAEKDLIVPKISEMEKKKEFMIHPSPLASFCGFSVNFSAKTMPSESGYWFQYSIMPNGFYMPAHRPMCVGQPLKFSDELEQSLNRLYFPIFVTQNNDLSEYRLVFSDPFGKVHICTIPCGQYTTNSICAYLQASMTETVNDPNTRYYVSYEKQRFIFECETKSIDGWQNAIFNLHFHHPLSVSPSRFGFLAQPYSGQERYTSAEIVHVADNVRNLIRVSEESQKKRLVIHAAAVPSMLGVVSSWDEDGIILDTFVNRMPFASGLQEGDIVRLSSMEQVDFENAENRRSSKTPVSLGIQSYVVAASPSPLQIKIKLPSGLLSSLKITGIGIQIIAEVQPWNMHFGKPNCLPASMMGWPETAVIWGRDGCTDGLPPYIAPNVYNFDHPDYVCITFSEGSGLSLEHNYNASVHPIFCKLSLYPLFREERMLPRDTSLLHGSFGSFTVAFWNPDMKTPYHFHGAEFSLSLAFFGQLPDMTK